MGHGDHVKVPNKLLAGGGEATLGGVDLPLLAVALRSRKHRVQECFSF